jgi:hypothetical protein
MKSMLLVLAVAAFPACVGAAPQDVVMAPRGEGATMIPAPPPGTSFARWEYLCLASSQKEDLNIAGQRGWELVSVASEVYSVIAGGRVHTGLIYCFKRPLDDGHALTVDESVKVSGDTVEVTRDFVDTVLTNPTAWLGTARALPHYVGRESKGIKLYAIEEGSLLHRIGLRTGDTVAAIGEHELRDTDDVEPAIKATRSRTETSISYIRDGAASRILVQFR